MTARICCIYVYLSLIVIALVIKNFSRTCDKVCSPLGSKTFYTKEAKIENDLIHLQNIMNQELDCKFTCSFTPLLMCSKPYLGQV